MTTLSGDVEVIYREAAPLDGSSYPGFEPRSYILERGSTHRPGGMPLTCDILVEQDVAVVLRDGKVIYTDIYRPVSDTRCPAIIGWSFYGKRGGALSLDHFGHPTRMDVPPALEDGLNKFEGPNPAYWVAHGYAVIAPDPRGVNKSQGDIHFLGLQEAEDEYDLIEWVGVQSWSNGKVGLTGTSALAMTQWSVAALRPPHLAAIAPWEGISDMYRDSQFRGGIPESAFGEAIFQMLAGEGRIEDIPAMARAHPLFNSYWQSKIADLEAIDTPCYAVGSWTNLLHTGGTFRAWRNIGSTAKWLRVHNSHEWTDYYNPAHVEDLRRFFDHFLKNEDNGWQSTPRIRLTVLDPGGTDLVNRAEAEFPLRRERHVPLYLTLESGAHVLRTQTSATGAGVTYESTEPGGIAFRITFDRDVELTGYMKLKLWVEAVDHDDMDIFAYVRKFDAAGVERQAAVVTDRGHLGPNGRLRVSLRALDAQRSTPSEPFYSFDQVEKVAPGDIVPVEIGFWPHSMRWRAGETLELLVSGTDLLVRPEFPQMPPAPNLNRGVHRVHFGGAHDSHLLVPLVGEIP